MYCQTPPIQLDHPEISDALRYIRIGANRERAKPQPALTQPEFIERLSRITDPTLRQLAILTWSHCARPSNVLKLTRAAIQMPGQSSTLQILWTDAKTAATRGPYTTYSTIGPHSQEISSLLQKGKNDLLFPGAATTHGALKLLKQLRTALQIKDLRMIRRGSHITLAESGVPEETLLVFSGHSSVESLRRYLRWGQSMQLRRLQATQAAAALW